MKRELTKSLNGNPKGRREQIGVLIGRVDKGRLDERLLKRIHVIQGLLPEASGDELRLFKTEVKEIVKGQGVIKSFSKAKMAQIKGVEDLA